MLVFLQVTIDNVGDVFSGFLFISTQILPDLISLGSAEAYIGWGGKLNDHLMASCVRYIHTKIIKIWQLVFKLQSKMSEMFFLATVYNSFTISYEL